MTDHPKFMEQAIALACRNAKEGAGGPFGAVIVKDGKIIAEGANLVTQKKDPTAHAEIEAIREACQQLNSYQLQDCIIYTSCEPCPMCLGAIYWARPAAVYYWNTREQAASAGFDDDFIYSQLNVPPEDRSIPFRQMACSPANHPFELWKASTIKIEY
ncbi:nucleoside deaminase [Paenibacillus senegalensis]|uniref:nucleoside deaminase n=1 Tax=Paenibacillus senegalensis TaxID=1465766 RepID=UPI000289033D|nr:nucleoside deaminase [Paenibacillus senegalensis]